MKTAMQELIEWIRYTNKECHSIMFNEGRFDEALEKEKEQIIDFHVMLMKHGLEQEGNVTKWDYNLLKDEAEEYYNQTYNQELKKEYQPSEEYLKKQRDNMEDFVWNKMNKNNQKNGI
jgi:predicted Fe-S protein YdhL (DUF1289 family)